MCWYQTSSPYCYSFFQFYWLFRVCLLFHIDLMIILWVPQNMNEKLCWDSSWNCTKFILIFWGYYNTESPNPRTCYTIPFAQMVFYVHHQYFNRLVFIQEISKHILRMTTVCGSLYDAMIKSSVTGGKIQQTGWCINNKNLFVTALESGESRIKVPSIQCLERAHFQVHRCLISLLCPTRWKRQQSWGLFHKGT